MARCNNPDGKINELISGNIMELKQYLYVDMGDITDIDYLTLDGARERLHEFWIVSYNEDSDTNVTDEYIESILSMEAKTLDEALEGLGYILFESIEELQEYEKSKRILLN